MIEHSNVLVDAMAEATKPALKGRVLTEADAIDIWIARWLRVRPKDLVMRYSCDTRRLYDIWWGKAFPASRARAQNLFAERYPEATDRTVFGYRRIPRGTLHDPRQPGLFDPPRRPVV